MKIEVKYTQLCIRGVTMPVVKDFELHLDLDHVLRCEGGDPNRLRQRKPIVDITLEMMAEGQPLLDPTFIFERFAVEGIKHHRLILDSGHSLRSELAASLLAPAQEVVLAICTIGPALEAKIYEYLAQQEGMRALALDAVGTAAIEMLGQQACYRLEKEAQAAGLRASLPISPGFEGWPMEEQRTIYELLPEAAKLGIVLTENAVLKPLKSVSMVIGFGYGEMGSATSPPCQFCAMRERCVYRAVGGESKS